MSKQPPKTRARSTVFLDPGMEKALDEIAAELGIKRADLARDALRRFIKSYEWEQLGYRSGVWKKDGDDTDHVQII